MLQEHSLFCYCFTIVNIGHFAVESESQTSNPSHESESESESESEGSSPSPKGRVRVQRVESESKGSSPSPSPKGRVRVRVIAHGDSSPPVWVTKKVTRVGLADSRSPSPSHKSYKLWTLVYKFIVGSWDQPLSQGFQAVLSPPKNNVDLGDKVAI